MYYFENFNGFGEEPTFDELLASYSETTTGKETSLNDAPLPRVWETHQNQDDCSEPEEWDFEQKEIFFSTNNSFGEGRNGITTMNPNEKSIFNANRYVEWSFFGQAVFSNQVNAPFPMSSPRTKKLLPPMQPPRSPRSDFEEIFPVLNGDPIIVKREGDGPPPLNEVIMKSGPSPVPPPPPRLKKTEANSKTKRTRRNKKPKKQQKPINVEPVKKKNQKRKKKRKSSPLKRRRRRPNRRKKKKKKSKRNEPAKRPKRPSSFISRKRRIRMNPSPFIYSTRPFAIQKVQKSYIPYLRTDIGRKPILFLPSKLMMGNGSRENVKIFSFFEVFRKTGTFPEYKGGLQKVGFIPGNREMMEIQNVECQMGGKNDSSNDKVNGNGGKYGKGAYIHFSMDFLNQNMKLMMGKVLKNAKKTKLVLKVTLILEHPDKVYEVSFFVQTLDSKSKECPEKTEHRLRVHVVDKVLPGHPNTDDVSDEDEDEDEEDENGIRYQYHYMDEFDGFCHGKELRALYDFRQDDEEEEKDNYGHVESEFEILLNTVVSYENLVHRVNKSKFTPFNDNQSRAKTKKKRSKKRKRSTGRKRRIRRRKKSKIDSDDSEEEKDFDDDDFICDEDEIEVDDDEEDEEEDFFEEEDDDPGPKRKKRKLE